MLWLSQVVANETKVVVQREEAEAAKKATETQAIADDAQRDLDEALPALVSTIVVVVVVVVVVIVVVIEYCQAVAAELQLFCVSIYRKRPWRV